MFLNSGQQPMCPAGYEECLGWPVPVAEQDRGIELD